MTGYSQSYVPAGTQLAKTLLQRTSGTPLDDRDPLFAAVASSFELLHRYLSQGKGTSLEAVSRRFDELAGVLAGGGSATAPVLAFVDQTQRYLRRFARFSHLPAPWRDVELPAELATYPTMHAGETRELLYWLGRTLEGFGDVVELGSWLGGTTCALARGMNENPRAAAATIFAIDSFRWETWMAKYLPDIEVPVPEPGDRYLDLFMTMCARYRDRIVPAERYVGGPNGYALPKPQLKQRGIELYVYDIGSDPGDFMDAWETFCPVFVAAKTIVVIGEFTKLYAAGLRELWCENEQTLTPLYNPLGGAHAFRYEGAAITP